MSATMAWAITVTDYREYESWHRARCVVCSVFNLTKSFSRIIQHRGFVEEINHLSVAILDSLARGYEGEAAFIEKACRAIDRLDERLVIAQQKRLLSASAVLRLTKELDAVRQLVQKEWHRSLELAPHKQGESDDKDERP